jgi:hypothetical protein
MGIFDKFSGTTSSILPFEPLLNYETSKKKQTPSEITKNSIVTLSQAHFLGDIKLNLR